MGKFFDNDYNEVEAFTQEEVDAKIKDAVAEEGKKYSNHISKEDLAEKYVTKEEFSKISEKLTKRSEEYKNLKEKYDEVDAKVTKSAEDTAKAYETARDDMITKVAGDDKEYAEELRKQYDRLGGEGTTDVSAIEKTMKEAHILAQTSLSREATEFSIPSMAGGAPEQKQIDDAEKPTEGEMAFLNKFR